MIRWKEDFSVNDETIDGQHKKLITMLNELGDAMQRGQGRKILDKILNELVSYTQSHFAYEERAMRACGYPGYDEHKMKHEKMTQKVLEIMGELKSGSANITPEVRIFLENWLNKHILGSDKSYAPYLGRRAAV